MKYTVKVTTKNPSNSMPEIALEWVVRAMEGKGAFSQSVISNGGVYKQLPYIPSAKIPEQAKDREKIVKVPLALVQSAGHLKLWSADFTWYDTDVEAENNGSSKEENQNIKTIINALKTHPEVSVKNEKNEETNKNVSPILLKYNFVDLTQRVERNVNKKLYTIEATSQLSTWYKNDSQKLIKFGYLWGYRNIKTSMTSQELAALFDYLVTQVTDNLDKYKEVMEYIESDMHVNIITASRLDKNGQKVIAKHGNFFVFNGNTVAEGNTIEECINQAVAYFSANAQDYMLLRNEIGVKEVVPQVKVVETKSDEREGLGVKSLADLNPNPHALKQEDKLKAKFANLIFKIVVEGKDVVAEKRGNAYKTFEESGSTPELSLIELSQFAEIKDNPTFQEFFQAEVNRIKEHRTPYKY